MKCGDAHKAGQCKQAAILCAQSTLDWLNTEHIFHIKNGYEPFSGFGCEPYGYFQKYMVTVASFAHFAYLLADDSIPPLPCACMSENFIHRTSDCFHKTFCKFGDYFLEYETRADFHYDSNGLGRIHKRGAPSLICLSVPATHTPNYKLDLNNPGPLSICAGMVVDGQMQFACEQGTNYTLMEHSVTDRAARMLWQVTLPCGNTFTEECNVTNDGILMRYACDGEITVLLPALETDGWRRSIIECNGSTSYISYEGWQCRYEADAPILLRPEVYANRNGHYRSLVVQGTKKMEIRVVIQKV